jgi:NitT/TauT family transport system substrate-binding protein
VIQRIYHPSECATGNSHPHPKNDCAMTHGSRSLTRAHMLGALAAAGAGLGARAAGAQTDTASIRIGASPADSYAQAHYAQEGGFFTKAGINAEILDFPNSQAIVQAAAGGAIDIGMADMIQLVNPIEKGVPFAYFAGGALYRTDAPATLLVASKATTFQKPKDFENQTIGVVALNSISSMSVSEWLRQGGANLSTIKIFELPFATMVPALQRGTCAACFLAEPFLSGAKGDLRVLASTYDVIAKQFYIGAWFGSRDWLTKNPAVTKRLIQALYDTARWTNSHHDESASILAKYTKLDPDRIKTMTRAVYATSIDPKLMQPVIDLAVRYKALDKPANAADLVFRA